MTTIIFIDHEGNETAVDAPNGESVMEAAINNDIEGIVAECGGACACATCHVYVDPAFRALTGEASEMEQAMLDFTDDGAALEAKLEALRLWGLVDVYRAQQPATDRFSWYDYRAGMFHKNMGMRIDLLYGTRSVADRVVWAEIDRVARKGPPTPSDHAPSSSSPASRPTTCSAASPCPWTGTPCARGWPASGS